MKRTTKKILGLVGLATVAALTVVAAGIPTPANALEPVPGTESSAEVEVEVYVIDEGETNVTITSPKNGSKVANPEISVETFYGKVTTNKYSLTYTNAEGESVTIPLGESTTPEYESGVSKWSFNLSDFDLGYGTYILHVDAYGNGSASDSIEFTYQPVVVTPATDGKSSIDEDGNAITSEDGYVDADISVSPKETPGYGEVYIYDSAGNRVVNPLTGEPITIPLSASDIASGRISLNLADYGLTNDQKYKVVFNVYDASGSLIGSDFFYVLYEVVSPDVPNTGGSLFASLNFSNSDFLISSLIVFSAITVAAFVLIKKSSRR